MAVEFLVPMSPSLVSAQPACCGTIKDFDRTPEQAVSLVPDAIRYAFQYRESRYTQGVLADIVRLKDHGFELSKLRNSNQITKQIRTRVTGTT